MGFWLAAAAAISIVTPSVRPVAVDGPPLGGPAVVVLWASWCASCRAELARLPKLAAAAAPLPVRTLAIDPPDWARALLVARGMKTEGAYADARDPAVVLDAWGGAGATLPLAVAIDSAGRVCGRKRGLLGTDQLAAWAKACR